MLDDIREWISDNLRYILLGLACILIVVIAFFAVRLVTGLGSSKGTKEKATEKSTEAPAEPQTESAEENQLVRNQSDVLAVVTRYYDARLNKDYDTLKEISEVFDDTVRADYERQDAAIESYSNIITYSKAGLTAGSYVVFVYFDLKLTGIETMGPALRRLYLITDDEGRLIISDPDSHPEQVAYAEQVTADEDVQALTQDVNDELEAKTAQDPDLKKYVEDSRRGAQGTDGDTGEEENGDEGGQDGADEGDSSVGTDTMYATTNVNVRGTPSADGTLYWTIPTGDAVEVLENLDSGWSSVRYVTADGTTIEGYVMTQYLTAQ